MDCREIGEILDAYVLGALERPEGEALERHVAACVRCWEDLNRAQKAAALLALSLPIRQPPAHLEQRIMAKAERERRPSLVTSVRSFLERRNLAAPIAAASIGAVIFAFAVFTQAEMNDLRGENNDLERQVFEATADFEQQRQIDAVLLASDSRKLPIEPASSRSDATGVYSWSPSTGTGAIMLANMSQPEPGMVYQAWFTFDGRAAPAGTCIPAGGICRFIVDISRVSSRPDGVGVSVEPYPGGASPSGSWVLFGDIDQE